MMKPSVALLGNMNNNFFTLARYLRDLGYDAHLFIFPYEPKHFRPETDTFSDDYHHFVHYLTWGNAFDLVTTSKETIQKDIGGFDFYIGSGTAPAYLTKAGLRMDIMIPYGSDLYDLPFFKLVRPTKLLAYYRFTRLQQEGIRNAGTLNILDNSDIFKKALAKIRFAGKRLLTATPIVYAPQYNPKEIVNFYGASTYYKKFEQIRSRYSLVIFHHSRHCWKNEPDPISLKDNDKLFRALAQLDPEVRKNIAIVTFEFGSDVEATRQLCRELSIENNVFWFPLMPRKEIMIGLSTSDIVAGEFRNSWFTYGVVYEAMVQHKPVMHFRDDTLYKEMELYPMIYAHETEDITRALSYFSQHPDEIKKIGAASYEWYNRTVLQRSFNEILQILSK